MSACFFAAVISLVAERGEELQQHLGESFDVLRAQKRETKEARSWKPFPKGPRTRMIDFFPSFQSEGEKKKRQKSPFNFRGGVQRERSSKDSFSPSAQSCCQIAFPFLGISWLEVPWWWRRINFADFVCGGKEQKFCMMFFSSPFCTHTKKTFPFQQPSQKL